MSLIIFNLMLRDSGTRLQSKHSEVIVYTQVDLNILILYVCFGGIRFKTRLVWTCAEFFVTQFI